MWSWITSASALVADNPGLAVLLAFAAAVIEAVAVLGAIVPGTPILMAVAAAAAMAGMPMLPILVVSTVGAILGDYVSYWVGRRYSLQLRQMWPFRTRPALIAAAE